MLRHKPVYEYSGLTIILSQASRFDTRFLLSGKSGQWFSLDCLASSGIKRASCDIRESEDRDPLLPKTTHILCLGERAMKEWIPDTEQFELKQVRGYVFDTGDGIKRMCSFLPIDCYDIVDWESKHNQKLVNEQHGIVERDDEDEDDAGQKKHGKTKRSNYRFWLEIDTRKLCRIMQTGFRFNDKFNVVVYPNLDSVIEVLLRTKDKHLYIDIETDTTYNINTIGFNFEDTHNVYVVPILRANYLPSYANLSQLFRALAIAFRDNIAVAHNGKSFDFWLFAWRYKIMIARRAVDTMLVQARIFPEAEKSLGHCISMWIDHWNYHKDDGVFMPNNREQEEKLWTYNGADVVSMRIVHEQQMKYAAGVPGLTESITQINASIRPYLIMEMTGIAYDDSKLMQMIRNNDRLMTQYLRCMRIMHGDKIEPLISNRKCVRYFNDALQYPVVARTPTGASKMDEKSLLQLQLKYPENPIIAFVIAFRALKKESGSLKFFPMWERLGELPTTQQMEQHEEKFKQETN